MSSFVESKSKLESHRKVFEIKYFCNVPMPSAKDTKILEFNPKKAGLGSQFAPTVVFQKMYFLQRKREKERMGDSQTIIFGDFFKIPLTLFKRYEDFLLQY